MIHIKIFFRSFSAAILIVMFAVVAHGQAIDPEDIESRQASIATISQSLDAGELDLVDARDALRIIRTKARTASETLTKMLADTNTRLESLGPIPEEDIAETPDVAERRKQLTGEVSEVTALIAQARLNDSDATRLLDGLTARQRESFLKKIFEVEDSVFRPSQWRDITSDASKVITKFPAHVNSWKTRRHEAGFAGGDILRAIGLLGLLIFLLWPFRIWINRKFAARLDRTDPVDSGRFIALVLHVVVRVFPAAFGFFAIYGALVETGFIAAEHTAFVKTFIYSILAVLLADGFAMGLFNPSAPKWRIIPLDNKPAKRARWLSVMAIALYGFGVCVSKLMVFDLAATGLDNGAMIITSIGVVILLVSAALFTPWQLQEDRADKISMSFVRWWSRLRKFALPVAVLISISLVFGYQNLACFLSERSIMLIGILVWVWVLRRGLLLVLSEFDQAVLARKSNVTSPSRQSMLFWAGLVIDAGILFAIIPIALLMLGTDSYTVRTGLMDAFTGVSIGNFTLSISDILAAIVTFFVILFVTRFLQKSLDIRLFSKSGADEGFRNSFRTLLGYVGLIIAIFTAIGVVGLDLSKLAIIAGALSVGIGFGLTSIINNFVSGLILLFERPIKVGDWVVTGSGEGIVKKISVRSTEIETFDRASIIVPNSELISSSVKNWTHKNKTGRVVVPVGIAYGSDAKKVRELLMKVATENALVLSNPKPFVYFKEFGASSLDLELRVFIKDVSIGPVVRNDLRFEILDVFRTEGIEIPFPQQDVHVKTYEQNANTI